MASPVTNFYNKRERNALITGATGFLGLALIEKLLRCFPSITLYLLIRSKYKKDAASRWEELKLNSIFDKLREEADDSIFQNVVVVSGDVGEENLGLSEADKTTVIDNVNVVYHCAATLDFEADLPTNVNVNLLGTKRVLELCAQLKKCEGFLHVSSAYVNSDVLDVEEEIYPAPEDTDKVIEITKSLDTTSLDVITKKLIKSHPNSYTFTKNLAEREVDKANMVFPTAIIRPSMILGSWREPVPGWTASKNGPQGFIMGAAKGVIRRLPINENLVYDYIPVDFVVNYMIVALWHASINWSKGNTTPVLHITSSAYHPFKWSQIQGKVGLILHQFPLKSAVWYPNLKFLPTLQRYRIASFIFHIIPGFFLDLLTRVMGGKPILLRLHSKVNKSLDQLETFIFTEWKFHNTKALRLQTALNEEDKEKFYLDIRQVDWDDFFQKLTMGIRLYLNKEKLSTLKAARVKNNVLFGLNLLVQALVLFLVWYSINFILSSPIVSVIITLLVAVLVYLFL